MSRPNKRNLVYFEGASMRGLYETIDKWQSSNECRLLSISVQRDGDNYCCIALTNPAEVVITSVDGSRHADVTPYAYTDASGLRRTTDMYGLRVL
jgi:hypothetical protein